MNVSRGQILEAVTKIFMDHFLVILIAIAGLIITGSVLMGDIFSKKITLVNIPMFVATVYVIKCSFKSSFLGIFKILSDAIWMRLSTCEAVYLDCFETETELMYMKVNRLVVTIDGNENRDIISRKPIVYKENSLIRIAYTSKSNILVKTELIEERDNEKKASRRRKR